LAEERVAVSQLKEQHSNELVKQKTKLDDACKHYQNTLKEEQGKLQLKEEELGAANSEISRIKSETAKQTDAVEVQKALVMELQGTICGLEEDLETAESEKQNLTNALAEKSHLLTLAQAPTNPKNRGPDPANQPQTLVSALKASASSAGAQSVKMAPASGKRDVQRVSSFNPSASPPSAKKHRESPKTKKRDKAKVLVAKAMQLLAIGCNNGILQGEDVAVRQADTVKSLSLHNSQAHYHQEEERQRRIFTWMENGNGAGQQAHTQCINRILFHAQTCTGIFPEEEERACCRNIPAPSRLGQQEVLLRGSSTGLPRQKKRLKIQA